MYGKSEAQCLDGFHKCVLGKAGVGKSDCLAAVLRASVHSARFTLGLGAQKCEVSSPRVIEQLRGRTLHLTSCVTSVSMSPLLG